MRLEGTLWVGGALLFGGLSLGCTPEQGAPPAAPAQPPPSEMPAATRTSPEPTQTGPSLESLEVLTSATDLKPHVDDGRVDARRVVVQRLAAIGGTATVPLLARMADDQDALVAARAITALSQILDGTYREVAAQALRHKSNAQFDQLLAVNKEQIGGPGLLTLLLGLPNEPKTRWYRQKAIFDALEQLHDPRVVNPLFQFTERPAHPHYEFRAAAELAQLGDPRAVPLLAERLRKNPLQLYSEEHDWERALRRDDNERVIAARLIADLALLHPDRLGTFRAQSEEALLFYLKDAASPHANGMRALAALGSKQALPDLRAWAFPAATLPKEGQQPPMPEEWVVAQSAQRYVGQLRDADSFKALTANLKARPPEIDVTMDALLTGGVAILGMSLRAIGIGAAQGLSEWGDPRAFQPLLAYVRDPMNNEQSRLEACTALAWLARHHEAAQLVGELLRAKAATKQDQFRRQCLLEGLARKATHVNGRSLLALLDHHEPDEVRSATARVLARTRVDENFEGDLTKRAEHEVSGPNAVLVLLLAASSESAVEAVQRHIGDLKAARERVAAGIVQALQFVSREDLESGFLFTLLRNTDAVAQAGHDWVQRAVVQGLSRVVYDNGPHSLTRTVLRYRLRQLAAGSKAEQRQRAIRALWYLRERGTLLALASSTAPDAELARTQAELLLKPEAPCEECPKDD